MKLRKILKNIKYKEVKGSLDIEISGISSDSQLVGPNNLFIAKKGLKFDATQFIYDAKDAGAIAVVTDIYDPFLKNIVQIICDDVNSVESTLACNYYQNPSKDLFSVAVTGTSGKTTTTYLLKSIMDETNLSCGLIGSVEYIIKDSKIPSNLTTPSSLHIQKYLREMVNCGLKSVCMEASSHGIEQGRLKNIDFDIAIFTNLTSDHLDYHKSIQNYKNAKKKLFDALDKKAYAIVNIDDVNYFDLIKDTKAKIFTYSMTQKADLYVTDYETSFEKTTFNVIYKDKKMHFFTSLIGKFNIYNILAAISAGLIMNIDLDKISLAIKKFKNVRGRLEKVENKKNLNIYVDHAHKEDALINVLSTLKDLKKNRIINVFGCGGDRDPSKRAKMAQASEKYSDISIVTSDNPRGEDPQKIIDGITPGFSKDFKYIVEIDRKKAIETAIKLAKDDDIIIITGKGHETYQIFKNATYDFDDVEVSKKICSTL